jgi:membrane protein DedA with SNARE-associated domain
VKRRTIFWTVAAVSCLIVLVIVGTVVFWLLDKDGAFGLFGVEDGTVAYLVTFGLVFADAVVPIFPGETTLNAASTLAAQDKLELGLVMLAGALGAILGDSALYWLARTAPGNLKDRIETASQKDKRVAKGLDLLGDSAPILICFGRYVPGLRFAINVSMGVVEYPYPRFLLWSAIGGAGWAVYTCFLAYHVSTALADFPLASIVISGLITTALIAVVYWLHRRRQRREQASPATTPGS